jgi:hypothetical protein
VNEEALAHWGAVAQNKITIKIIIKRIILFFIRIPNNAPFVATIKRICMSPDTTTVFSV